MAIDINSLFADIIDTPEQRQQKLLQQGMLQGQLLSSGLRGRAAALAPLAQIGGQLGVQRNDALRRAVQPMIGIDPRSTGERVAAQIQGLDMSTPEGMLQAAQALQSIDPVRAAALRQAASQQTIANQDRERQMRREDVLDEQRAAEAQRAEARLPFEIAQSAEALQASVEGRQERSDRFELFKTENDLRIQNLRDTNLSAAKRREQEEQLQANKTEFEQSIAGTFGDSELEQAMSRAVSGGLFTVDTLQQLATTPATDYTLGTAQYREGDKLVNYNVARNKNDPTQVLKLERATNQPAEPELTRIPALTKDQQEQYEKFVEENPALNDLVQGRRGIIFRGDPVIAKQGLINMLQALQVRDGKTLQEAANIINRSSLDDIQAGVVRSDLLTAADDAILSDPAFSGFSVGVSPAQTEQQPAPQATQQMPNLDVNTQLRSQPFNVAEAGRPTANVPTMGTGGATPSPSYEARVVDAQQGIQQGRFSPERLKVIHNQFVEQQREEIRQASAELRYLEGAKGIGKEQKDARKARERQRIANAQQQLALYPRAASVNS